MIRLHYGVKQLKVLKTTSVLHSFVWNYVKYTNMAASQSHTVVYKTSNLQNHLFSTEISILGILKFLSLANTPQPNNKYAYYHTTDDILTLYMPSYLFPSSGAYLDIFLSLQLRTTLTGLPFFQSFAWAPFSLIEASQFFASALDIEWNSLEITITSLCVSIPVHMSQLLIRRLRCSPPVARQVTSTTSSVCKFIAIILRGKDLVTYHANKTSGSHTVQEFYRTLQYIYFCEYIKEATKDAIQSSIINLPNRLNTSASFIHTTLQRNHVNLNVTLII